MERGDDIHEVIGTMGEKICQMITGGSIENPYINIIDATEEQCPEGGYVIQLIDPITGEILQQAIVCNGSGGCCNGIIDTKVLVSNITVDTSTKVGAIIEVPASTVIQNKDGLNVYFTVDNVEQPPTEDFKLSLWIGASVQNIGDVVTGEKLCEYTSTQENDDTFRGFLNITRVSATSVICEGTLSMYKKSGTNTKFDTNRGTGCTMVNDTAITTPDLSDNFYLKLAMSDNSSRPMNVKFFSVEYKNKK